MKLSVLFDMLSDSDKQEVMDFLMKKVNETVLSDSGFTLVKDGEQKILVSNHTRGAQRITVFGKEYRSINKALEAYSLNQSVMKHRMGQAGISKQEAIEQLAMERGTAPAPKKKVVEQKPIQMTIGGQNV